MSYEQALKEHYAGARARLFHPVVVARAVELEPKKNPPRALLPPPLDLLAPPTWRLLLRVASLKTGVPEEAILGGARDVVSTYARHMAMTLVYSHMEVSYGMMSCYFRVDHTTILAGIRRFTSGASRKRYDTFLANRSKRGSVVPRPRLYARCRWTPAEIAEAMAMRDDGMMLKDIGKWFGVSANAVQAMLKRASTKAPAFSEEERLAA